MSAPVVVNTTDGTVWTRREATRDGLALYAPEKCAGCPEFVMATYAELEGHGVAGTADVLPMPVGSEPQALSPERLAEIREHVAETRNWSLGNLAARDLLAEVDRLRAERDEFCNRVDTLTAVAQGNKRHVVSLTVECQRLTARITELEAERHSTNEALDDAVQALRAVPKTVFRASHDSIVMGLYDTAAVAREHCEALIRREMPDNSLDWIEDEEDGVAELTVWVGGEECTTGYVVTALGVASKCDLEADE